MLYGTYELFELQLRRLSQWLSYEVIYRNLRKKIFFELYSEPITSTRLNDLRIQQRILHVCDSVFSLLDDQAFEYTIKYIFQEMMNAIVWVLLKSPYTKQFTRNDYQLVKDDIISFIESFASDIPQEFLQEKSQRLLNVIELIKLSTTHLTEHSIPNLKHKHTESDSTSVANMTCTPFMSTCSKVP